MKESICVGSANEPKLKRVMNEVKTYLESHYEFRFNQLTEHCEYREKKKGRAFAPLVQRVENSLVMQVIDSGVDCFDRDVKRYLHSEAVPTFHPIRSFISMLPHWDGKDRVKQLALRICDDSFWVTVFHRWMLGLVAQWTGMNKLHGNSMMPILISRRQGLNKSTFCRALLPPELRSFYTDKFDITAKSDPTGKLAKFALINVDEMSRMTGPKMEQLKNILQYADVNICRAYERNYSQMPRLASFIGTSNFRELLTDPTGPRRFFPVMLKERIGRLYIAYKQLYAQLKEELGQGKRYWFTLAEETKIIEHNRAFMRRPVEESLFFSCFRLPKKYEESRLLTIGQIFDTLKRKSPSTMRDIKMPSFGEHLAMMGVEKKHCELGAKYSLCPAI